MNHKRAISGAFHSHLYRCDFTALGKKRIRREYSVRKSYTEWIVIAAMVEV